VEVGNNNLNWSRVEVVKFLKYLNLLLFILFIYLYVVILFLLSNIFTVLIKCIY